MLQKLPRLFIPIPLEPLESLAALMGVENVSSVYLVMPTLSVEIISTFKVKHLLGKWSSAHPVSHSSTVWSRSELVKSTTQPGRKYTRLALSLKTHATLGRIVISSA